MNRVQFVSHGGKRILHIDMSNLKATEIPAVVEQAKKTIAAEPHNSLLTLTNITNAEFNSQINKLAKEYTAHNKPYVRAAAIVGTDGLRKALVFVVSTFSGRDLAPFDSVDEAKDWLAKF